MDLILILGIGIALSITGLFLEYFIGKKSVENGIKDSGLVDAIAQPRIKSNSIQKNADEENEKKVSQNKSSNLFSLLDLESNKNKGF